MKCNYFIILHIYSIFIKKSINNLYDKSLNDNIAYLEFCVPPEKIPEDEYDDTIFTGSYTMYEIACGGGENVFCLWVGKNLIINNVLTKYPVVLLTYNESHCVISKNLKDFLVRLCVNGDYVWEKGLGILDVTKKNSSNINDIYSAITYEFNPPKR